MPIAMPSTFKISVKAACPSHARTDATMRRHTLVIDEPSERGSTDVGPTPLETLLAAYLGCTNVILNLLAEEMGVILEGLSLALSASFDTRGVFDKAPVAVPFPEIAGPARSCPSRGRGPPSPRPPTPAAGAGPSGLAGRDHHTPACAGGPR